MLTFVKHTNMSKPGPKPKSTKRMNRTIDRFFERLLYAESGCWEWTGNLTREGYGQISYGQGTKATARCVTTHRFSYELFLGEIPFKHHVHHRCGNRACCNPDHLEAIPVRTHLALHDSPVGQAIRTTHCPKGHPYDEANTYRYRNVRHCRACQRIRYRQWTAAHPDYQKERYKKLREQAV